MKLGEIIKKFRYDNDMTMQEFADKSGLSKGYISMLEKNKHPQSKRELVPSFETYKKVASAMCMPLDDFLAALDGDEVVKVNAAAPAPAQLVGNVESVNNFGDRLHSLRKSKSLTQEAFASSLNERYDLKINKSMVSKWENNIDTPSLNSAKYIAIFFDVSLDYLLGVSDDKSVVAVDASAPADPLQLTEQEEHLVVSFRSLNEDGRKKAVERVEELLDVPRYRMDAVSTRIWQDAEKVEKEIENVIKKKAAE